MSWFKKDVEATIRFQLRPQETPLAKADYDLLMVKPDKTSTYTNDGITVLSAPTPTANGYAEYTFTPDQEGRYMFTLGYGSNTAFTELSYYEFNTDTTGQATIEATTAVQRVSKDDTTKASAVYGADAEAATETAVYGVDGTPGTVAPSYGL